MGNYLNPGNSGFTRIRNDVYIDKSGLIGLINQTIDTPGCLTCISRPRRFGKSFAAQMLCAYYDKTYPNSVMKAVRNDDFDSYWTQTSAAESLMGYISLDFDGLGRTVSELIGGVETKVDTRGFANDLVTFRDRDDVLTLLIHLGYLTYDERTEKVHIPNEEIKLEFARAIRRVKRDDTIRRIRESEQLIEDTIHGDEEAVARQIEKVHEEESALYYNNEQALRSVIKRAYFSYGDEYVMFEELPAGAGCADIMYLPKRDSALPALLIELKWNQSARSALEQIHDRRYPEAAREYGGEVLLVGISYDKNAPEGKRKHQCKIEKCT